MKKNSGGLRSFKSVLKYMGGHRTYLILSLMLSAVSVAAALYIPVLIGETADGIVGKGLVDFGIVSDKTVRIVLSALIGAGCNWLSNRCNNRLCFDIVRDIRVDAYRRINALPLAYIDAHPHGEIISRVISDADQISDGLLMGISQLFSGVLTILGTLFFMFRIRPIVALVVVCITPLSFFVASFVSKKTYDMFRMRSSLRGRQTAFIQEMTEGQRDIRAFNAEERIQNDFDGINEPLRAATLKATFYSSITNPCTRFVNSVVYAGVCLSGALLAVTGGFTVGNMVSFLSYANHYTKPFNEISGVITELQNALACADRVLTFINDTPVETECPEATRLKKCDGTFSFQHVRFGYSEERPVLRDVDFDALQGKRIAVVGPTGCGKTTLINLLMRFYEPDAGEVLVSGTDNRMIVRDSIRSFCGMVLQDTWLKHGTVADNISFGCPNASREDIVRAAKAAMAHGFITRLPNGYDTVISETNGNLSEGQRQLICIARVMMNHPDILILDEATSSIDVRTESAVQRAIEELMNGRTSLVVAHRLSTIENADTILVLKDGIVHESGTHKELLEKDGFYRELYQSQFSGQAI